MSFDQFMKSIEQMNISEICCLTSQFILTVHTCFNLNKNKKEFPVKQLSPLLSLFALLSFLFTNIISLIAKIIQKQNNYYQHHFQNKQCGQCRIYQHTEMIVLAFIYNGLREVPLIIFIIKTYRVCLCYTRKFQKQLSSRVISVFQSQRRLLILILAITIIYLSIGYFVFNQGTPFNGILIFEFFCPKQSSMFDWLVTSIRFLSMTYIYIISLYSYAQLDFKKFLVLIFILTNTEVILRLFLALQDITKTTYHQFYYHSFFMNTFGTIIMFFYSNIKEQRNRPLEKPILERFNAFIQTRLGCSVIYYYVTYLDSLERQQDLILNKNTFLEIFEAKMMIDQLIRSSDEEDIFLQQHYEQIQNILRNIEILEKLEYTQQLLEKCHKKQLKIRQLKMIEQKLQVFCEVHIYNKWRNTVSAEFLQNQFRNNTIINVRMSDLKIAL